MCDIEGWLEKKGGFVGIWHKRFCTLHSGLFCIYKDSGKKQLTRTFKITKTSSVVVVDGKRSFCFSVTPEGDKTYHFQALNEEDEIKWLNNAIQALYPDVGPKLEDFEPVAVIGRGFYGKVMLAKHKETGKLVAIKSIHKKELIEKNKVETVLVERDVLMKTNNPFIINLLCSFQTPSKFYFVLEYASGGDLFGYLKKYENFPKSQVQLYIAELAIALNHLHQNNIIYRDLKPENVLFCADGHLKLTDFGISKILNDPNDTTRTLCGTSEYLAPEVIEGAEYSFAIDWWQLGCLMYEMYAGRTPFANENQSMMYRNITTRNVGLFPIKDPQAKELISVLLKKNPQERGGFEEIKNSEFFKGFDWDKCMRREIQPPYIPVSKSQDDLSNFDSTFTNEPTYDSNTMPVTERFDDFAFMDPKFVNE